MPNRQIRALFSDETIRVYQAFNDAIADSALSHKTFQSPPFKLERMTWIKPSFLWMMYRAGWGLKDSGQNRILAIDITRKGFEWALENSVLSHDYKKYADKEEWQRVKKSTPVRIQWDPERDFHFNPLDHRSIQIGLSNQAVEKYVNEWIVAIEDITPLAAKMHSHIQLGNLQAANHLLPKEQPYPLSNKLTNHLSCENC
ncbi:DUF4291 domain-containing protein [Thaumasiovibrio subtropicus]|uniref:DUF4291 domain-containing protein n=1 Tax=Thaumasiovibrio subtropicus TaxID=1891207 RepID=UPI000B351A5B|nr:DUF4291 domain-containing protein [Thaumasiovibrio subtropicus]